MSNNIFRTYIKETSFGENLILSPYKKLSRLLRDKDLWGVGLGVTVIETEKN